ncbi:hypothetical protein ACFLXQ_01785 [Chloroflexota bacterium]
MKLEVAVAKALAAQQQNDQALVPQSPVHAIRDVYQDGDTPSPTGNNPNFEQMFRAAAARQPPAAEAVEA